MGLGTCSLYNNTTGIQNCAVGASALFKNITGGYNTAIGNYALAGNTAGSNSLGAGAYAGYNDKGLTGNNTYVGYQAGYANTIYTNTTCIGYNSVSQGNYTLVLGNSNVTSYSYGAVQNISDERDKAEIRKTTLGLEFINQLNPVDFKWDLREDYSGQEKDGSKIRYRYHHGLIAQDVEKVVKTTGVDFGGLQDFKINGGKDAYTIGYTELIGPLIKAVQELSEKVEELENK